MARFQLLEQAEEGMHHSSTKPSQTDNTDQLHTIRLLPVEERPWRRLSKIILGPNAPFEEFVTRSVTARDTNKTMTSDETAAESNDTPEPLDNEKYLRELNKFRESITYEFSLFESNLARIQLLRAANDAERNRYAAEKSEIEGKADDVRTNISGLRTQLEQAQQTLAIRKTYDVLADKITSNASLKPRDEQHVNIEKLKSEIEELERESQELSQTWLDRRAQLARVVDEAKRLRRQIHGEKEPGAEGEDEDDEEMGGIDRDRSNIGTPRPGEDASTPLPEGRSRAGTPALEGLGTPLPTTVVTEPVEETLATDAMDTT
jgi:hypothetical protein